MGLQARPHSERREGRAGSGDGGHHQKGPLGDAQRACSGSGISAGIDPFRPVNVATLQLVPGKRNAPHGRRGKQLSENGRYPAKGPSGRVMRAARCVS